MDTKELKFKKKEYEGKISEIIAGIMEQFQQETGIAISGCFINIDLIYNQAKEIKTSIYGVNICLDI